MVSCKGSPERFIPTFPTYRTGKKTPRSFPDVSKNTQRQRGYLFAYSTLSKKTSTSFLGLVSIGKPKGNKPKVVQIPILRQALLWVGHSFLVQNSVFWELTIVFCLGDPPFRVWQFFETVWQWGVKPVIWFQKGCKLVEAAPNVKPQGEPSP